MKLLYIRLFGVVFFLPSIAWSQIAIKPMQIDLLSDRAPRSDITINNLGSSTAYVQIDTYVVLSPGESKETHKRIKHPNKLGLLVTPRKLAIAPGQTQYVRVAMLKPFGNKERVYRFIVRPVSSEIIGKKQKKSLAAMVNIVVAYSLLVIVRPKAMAPKLDFRQIGKTLEARNLGNTAILMASGEQCTLSRKGSKKSCVTLPAKRLYAGNIWKLNLPSTGKVTFQQVFPGTAETISPILKAEKSRRKKRSTSINS